MRIKIELDRWIELMVVLMMAIGTVFVFSASANITSDYDLRRFTDFTTLKQLMFFPLGVGLMYLVSCIDYRRYGLGGGSIFRTLCFYMLVISLLMLVLVLIPGVGIEKNQSRRWLPVPFTSFSFQPSELAKWTVIIFLAGYLDRFSGSMNLFWKRFVPACLVALAAVSLIVIHDFGTAAFIVLLTFFMLLIGGAKWWHFLTPLPIVVPGFIIAIMCSPTRMNRIKDFLNAESISYQARQSLIAISTGSIFGKGLGRGILKHGHLPEDTTDFIFSIISEELGFVGAITVIGLFVLFVLLGLAVVLRCRDRFGRSLAAGIVMTIGTQASINIGVVTVVLPTKGIPLPFISAGGTSMLVTAAAVGVLLSIAKRGDIDSTESLRGQNRFNTVETADNERQCICT